jgi:NitT/TauT family transport system substrate-binding protein
MRRFFVAFCVLLLLAMLGWKLSEPWREKLEKDDVNRRTSDAGAIKHQLTVCGDEWLGYLVFRSPEFRRRLEDRAIAVTFQIEPDFQKRFEMLADGRCDVVCATIDSFLVNARSTSYPGVIVFGIDESYGGDAIITREGIETLDDLKGENIRGAFVGYSPSEFLLKSQIAHFGIEGLKSRLPDFRTDDADTAYQNLKDGKVDFAVLWEPLVARALREIPGSKRLVDTRSARGIIYDVAIASRKLVASDPGVIKDLTEAYFESLNHYFIQAEEFKKLARSDSGESSADAEKMLGGIRFLTITDNREMVSGSADLRMTDAVSNISRILVSVGDLSGDPLSGNPRLVINSQFVEQSSLAAGSGPSGPGGPAAPARRFFLPLEDAQWAALYENRAGTLLEEPITFDVGQSSIPEDFQAELRDASQKLVHYPNHRMIVQAHVSPGTDAAADLELSQARADAIRDFLVSQAGVTLDRIHSMGVGGAEPLAKKPGESLPAWKRRCRRARIFLAEDT